MESGKMTANQKAVRKTREQNSVNKSIITGGMPVESVATISSTVRVYNTPTWSPRHLQPNNPINMGKSKQVPYQRIFGTKKVEKGSNKKVWFEKKSPDPKHIIRYRT
jgi:hypothetical protein